MKNLLLVPFITFFAVSCSSNTPQTRIEKNPKIYRSLTEAEKALVEVGKIQNGMSPPAVFLAWGSPDGRAEGESKGNRYEQWVYRSLRPVAVQSTWGGWGPGWRGWGGWGPWGWSNGIATNITYIPQDSSWVKFVNNKVESWQLGDPPAN